MKGSLLFMATSKILGEVSRLYCNQGECSDPMKTIIAIDYAVERSVIDIDELNGESEKGCLFVAKDGTIYDGVSYGEESEAHYKLVPTGLNTKFNNVPLLASFCKDKEKRWQGVYVGTLDKLFETYKEFYSGQHAFSDQYIDLCYGERPLLNLYGFGLKEILGNDDNYVFDQCEEDTRVYNIGNVETNQINVTDKLTSLNKSLERAQKQLHTSKLSKSKRRKLETRINQIKSDIDKQKALIEKERALENEENAPSIIEEVAKVEEVSSVNTLTTPNESDKKVEQNDSVNSSDSVESTDQDELTESTPKKRGRRATSKSSLDTTESAPKRKAKTKAEIAEELEQTKKALADCKDAFDKYVADTEITLENLKEENSRLSQDSLDSTTVENDELAKRNAELNDKYNKLLKKNIELARQVEVARKANCTNTSPRSSVDSKISIDESKLNTEASEIMNNDFADTSGIKQVCDVIYKKLLNQERWMLQSGDNGLRFYIKNLMLFIYNRISKVKQDGGNKNSGDGYVFSSNKKKLLINTNLIDCYGNFIYIIDHTPHEKQYSNKTVTVMQSKSNLVADGFSVESVRHLPGCVKFFDKSNHIFDACIEDFDLEDEEHLNHIINERRYRFPESYKDVPAKNIADKLRASIEQAIRISEVDYRYIMPMYNPNYDEIEFLIPFYLDNHYGQRPELAIIVSKKQSFWRVFTVIKTEYAYFNARLLCNPNSSML